MNKRSFISTMATLFAGLLISNKATAKLKKEIMYFDLQLVPDPFFPYKNDGAGWTHWTYFMFYRINGVECAVSDRGFHYPNHRNGISYTKGEMVRRANKIAKELNKEAKVMLTRWKSDPMNVVDRVEL